MMNNVYDLLKELNKDFLEKRNKIKILRDNLKEEIEVLEKTLEHIDEINDESKLFSPRNTENDYISVEDMKKDLDQKYDLYNEYCNEYEYYSDYCKKIKNIIKEEEKRNEENIHDINDIMYGNNNKIESPEKEKKESMENIVKTEEETKEYSLNLNYNIDDIKNKITSIKHKSDTCLKIFNNDKNRAKQEIISINKSLDSLIKSM